MTPFRTVAIFIAIALLSIAVIPDLDIDLLPHKTSEVISLSYAYPGATSEITESKVTAQLENAFSALRQLKRIESASGSGQGNITLQFDKGADMDMKRFETLAILRQVFPLLPQGVTYPDISLAKSDGTSSRHNGGLLLAYTVHGPVAAHEIARIAADILQKPLLEITGIRDVHITGGGAEQLTIAYDRHKLQAWHLTEQDINRVFQSSGLSYYPGKVSIGNKANLFIKAGAIEPPANALAQTVIAVRGGVPVRLSDVASVWREEQEPLSYFRINGKNAVNLAIEAKEGENKIRLANDVQQVIGEARLQLPAGFDLRLEYDDTAYLRKEMSQTKRRTLLSVGILSLFVLLSYRSWRYLLTLFSGLVVNIALVILCIWALGIKVHLYSLAGLAVSFGMMIDNSIVVLDYYRQRQSREVFIALLGATLTTIAALLPIYLLPEEDQQNLGDFVAVVVVALGTSMAVALGFIPGLYELVKPADTTSRVGARPMRIRKRVIRRLNNYARLIAFLSRWRKTFMLAVILMFGLPVFLVPSKIEGWDRYNDLLGRDYFREYIRPPTERYLGGALGIFMRQVYEKSGYREPGKTRLYINASLPIGNTPAQMDNILSKVEDYLTTVKGIDRFVTHVNSGQSGSIEIGFLPRYEAMELPYLLKSQLIARSIDWSGVGWDVYGVGQGFSNAGMEDMPSFKVVMHGYHYYELERQAHWLADTLLAHPRIHEVNINALFDYDDRSDYQYVLNTDAAGMSLRNISREELLGALKQRSKPDDVQTYTYINDKRIPVQIREKESPQFAVWNAMNEPLFKDTATQVKLGHFSSMELQKISPDIHREDRQYVRMVGFTYTGSGRFGNEYLDKVLQDWNKQAPPGYKAEKEYYRWDWGKKKRQYSLILLILILNYLVCAILFENLRQPFYIILTAPISFIGLFLIFAWGDFYFDQGGFAAFVLLAGLSVNSAIFIVNDWNSHHKMHRLAQNGKLLDNKSIIKVIYRRARTVLLTTISTICGMIPFLVEGQTEVFWFSLAIGTTGGLLFSLFAVFVFLPAMMYNKDM